MTRWLRPTVIGPILLVAGFCGESFASGTDCLRSPDAGAGTYAFDHADPVVRQALAVLGRRVNPVEVVPIADVRTIYARVLRGAVPPAGLSAFRVPGDPTIYVNGDSLVYLAAARAPSAFSLLRLAATLLHEQAHDTEGEAGAYRAQADFVRSRLMTVPWRHRAELARLLQELDAQARAREIVERLVQVRHSKRVTALRR